MTTHKEKLLEKLNLDGLSNWTPQNAAAAKELVLAFHDIFTLDGNEFVQLSTKSASMIVNPSKSDSDAYLHHFWRRCAPHSGTCWMRGDTPQPIPMVQCSGASVEKGWITMLLCRLLQAQCTYQEGLVSLAANSGSTGEYGGCCALLHDGFQEQILASKNGTLVPAVYHFYCGKPGVL